VQWARLVLGASRALLVRLDPREPLEQLAARDRMGTRALQEMWVLQALLDYREAQEHKVQQGRLDL
jgi:hypothetical protein